MIEFNCPVCGIKAYKSTGHYNRAIKENKNIFCSKPCSHESRRQHIDAEIKKEEKRLYDIEYRKENAQRLKQDKKDFFQKDYAENPEKYRATRQRRMKSHVEYCRQPKYREYKKKYDVEYRKKNKNRREDNRRKRVYGEYADANKALNILIKEKNK